MTSRQRMIAALDRGVPDRLPVTTHHIMRYFTETYLGGISDQEVFDRFGLDAILWLIPLRGDPARGEYLDPDQGPLESLQVPRVISDSWRIESEVTPGDSYMTKRFRITTPQKTLTATLQSNVYTEWVSEPLVKEKADIEIVERYQTQPLCDVEAVNRAADEMGERGIVRGFGISFDIYGQPGCWQDFCCLRGTQTAIMDTFDDPKWVHEFLRVLQTRKLAYLHSLAGARYDIVELGGGDASTTVISPSLFDEFVAPYDTPLVEAVHEAGTRVVYHTCGGMMPILEKIAAMGPDAMETFTPPSMGADVDLGAAKRRIGERVCMIGGFDQAHYLYGCTEEETRSYVRRCFEEAGRGGGYILAPSDHFFDADVRLIEAFADEARQCTYDP